MNSALWGPLLFVFDVSPENQISGFVITVLLAAAILSFPLRPRTWTAAIAICGLAAWLFVGAIGSGINC
jgi:hypothetical protein